MKKININNVELNTLIKYYKTKNYQQFNNLLVRLYGNIDEFDIHYPTNSQKYICYLGYKEKRTGYYEFKDLSDKLIDDFDININAKGFIKLKEKDKDIASRHYHNKDYKKFNRHMLEVLGNGDSINLISERLQEISQNLKKFNDNVTRDTLEFLCETETKAESLNLNPKLNKRNISYVDKAINANHFLTKFEQTSNELNAFIYFTRNFDEGKRYYIEHKLDCKAGCYKDEKSIADTIIKKYNLRLKDKERNSQTID